MRIDLLPALSKVASTVRDDFADGFTAPLSAISWAGGLRFVGYAAFVLLLRLGSTTWASPLRLLVLPFGGWRANKAERSVVGPERTVERS